MCAKKATPPPSSGCASGGAAVQQLEDEPDAEEEHRRHLAEDEEDQRQHLRARQQHEVGAEHRRDRAARADVRDRRVGVAREGERDEGLGRRRREAAEEVEEEEADLAERVLDVVAEDPEEEHVAEQVHPAAVQEHRRERGQEPALPDRRARALDLARVVAELVDRALQVGELVEDPDEHVRDDQRDRDERERPRRHVVAERQHGAMLSGR